MMEIPLTELRENLAACLSVQRWIDDVVLAAPFDDVAGLLAVANDAATPLSPAEIDEAIAHHPRIEEKPHGDGAPQDFSGSEQLGLGDDGSESDLAAAIAAGNKAYEDRFGRVFIIRAAGRTPAEILEELERRLALPNSTELEIVGEQLREIALLRLEKIYGRELR